MFGHKSILSPRCEVFKAMFAQASDSKPKLENGAHVFVLSDTQPHIFLAVIEFIYTNRWEKSVNAMISFIVDLTLFNSNATMYGDREFSRPHN